MVRNGSIWLRKGVGEGRISSSAKWLLESLRLSSRNLVGNTEEVRTPRSIQTCESSVEIQNHLATWMLHNQMPMLILMLFTYKPVSGIYTTCASRTHYILSQKKSNYLKLGVTR